METGQYDGVSASGTPHCGSWPVHCRADQRQPADQLRGYQPEPQGPAVQHIQRRALWRAARLGRQPADVAYRYRQAGAGLVGVVFDPNSPYKGKITAYDDPIYIADAALYLKSTRPDLHITDPYELDTTQFNATVNLLKAQHTVIGTYWSDYTKEQSAFANADSVVGTTWQVIANLLLTDKNPTPVAVTVPKEGSTGCPTRG